VQSLVRRIMLGGQVEQAKLLEQSPLVYPKAAVLSHIEGTVVLRAIIDKQGNVSELHIVSGHPLLASSAMDAIRGWRYQATLLNGSPVEVDTTITVTFVLHKTAAAIRTCS
jgi:protein TonB